MASLSEYLASVDGKGDFLDYAAKQLLADERGYSRVRAELDLQFDSGETEILAMNRGGKPIWIRREVSNGNFRYLCGEGDRWSEPDDLIWVLAMFQLARDLEAWRDGVQGEFVRG